MEPFQQKSEFLIDDLELLKVLADPLRTQIMETLVMEPLTVKQVADRLGLAPSKLYYHVNMLEQHGMLQVVETRMVANMVEKYYQTVASSFRVAPDLLTFSTAEGQDNISTLLAATLDTTRADIMRALEARSSAKAQQSEDAESTEAEDNKKAILLVRGGARIPESRAAEFRARLSALHNEFDSADDDEIDEPKHLYGLTIAFYPVIYFPEGETNQEEA